MSAAGHPRPDDALFSILLSLLLCSVMFLPLHDSLAISSSLSFAAPFPSPSPPSNARSCSSTPWQTATLTASNAREWREKWRRRMHNYTENHPAPAVCLQTPLELPLGIAGLSAWHRAKAGAHTPRVHGLTTRTHARRRAGHPLAGGRIGKQNAVRTILGRLVSSSRKKLSILEDAVRQAYSPDSL